MYLALLDLDLFSLHLNLLFTTAFTNKFLFNFIEILSCKTFIQIKISMFFADLISFLPLLCLI